MRGSKLFFLSCRIVLHTSKRSHMNVKFESLMLPFFPTAYLPADKTVVNVIIAIIVAHRHQRQRLPSTLHLSMATLPFPTIVVVVMLLVQWCLAAAAAVEALSSATRSCGQRPANASREERATVYGQRWCRDGWCWRCRCCCSQFQSGAIGETGTASAPWVGNRERRRR